MSIVVVIAVLGNISVIGVTNQWKVVKNRAKNCWFVKHRGNPTAAKVGARILACVQLLKLQANRLRIPIIEGLIVYRLSLEFLPHIGLRRRLV